jgi:hypothetical protein
MTDNITLPRVVVEQARFAMKRRILRDGPLAHEGDIAALAALDAALAEPEKERAETVTSARCVAGSEKPASSRDESYRTTEPPAKPEPVHPGYIIGSHWLETAYSRIAAGESEAAVLVEVLGARGWVKPEPATDAEIVKAGGECAVVDDEYLLDFRDGFRAAERFHNIRGSKP